MTTSYAMLGLSVLNLSLSKQYNMECAKRFGF